MVFLPSSKAYTTKRRAIGYYRVSTKRQGESGLGLEAQKATVRKYCKDNGFTILNEMVEIQSARKKRPGLQKTIELCKRSNSTLVVARLDRLSANMIEVVQLTQSSSVNIVFVDTPYANNLDIYILTAIAQEQRRMNSENTKAALQAARKRGVRLGIFGKVIAKENKRKANEFAQHLIPTIKILSNQGFTTIRKITEELNKRKIPTYQDGSRWHSSSVFNLLRRMKKIS